MLLKIDELTFAHEKMNDSGGQIACSNFVKVNAYFKTHKVQSQLKVFLLQSKERVRSPMRDIHFNQTVQSNSSNPFVKSN